MENNRENAMKEIVKAVEIVERLKEIDQLAKERLDDKICEMKQLSKSDHQADILESANRAVNIDKLIDILNTFDIAGDGTHSIRLLKSGEHMDRILKIIGR